MKRERRQYNVSLDVENTKRIKAILKKRHMTFSGFIDAQVMAVLDAWDGMDITDPGEMKVKDLGEYIQKIVKIMMNK